MKLIFTRSILIMLTIGYMAFIWLQTSYFNPESVNSLSSQINRQIILLIGISLELAHLFEFGFLYLLIIIAFLSFGELTKRKEYIAILISFLYGFVDEIHQIYIPFRSASIDDLVKNTIGILFLWWIVKKYYYKDRNTRIGRLLRRISPGS